MAVRNRADYEAERDNDARQKSIMADEATINQMLVNIKAAFITQYTGASTGDKPGVSTHVTNFKAAIQDKLDDITPP